MAQRLIGVDVGGTKVSVAVLEAGRLSEPHLQPTDTSSTDALLDQLAGLILEAADGAESAAVGIGIPSVVEWDTGRVKSSVNIPLHDVPLRHALAERTGLDIYVDNDATVAALAEASDDAGEIIHQYLVMLTVGTGVGGGIIIAGRIFRGATGGAPEYGHIIIGADLTHGAPPSAERPPHPGSLEALAAGKQLDVLARERGFADGPAVVDAAQAGDERAIEAVRILGERLGVGIANAINTFDPEVVCVGGGVSVAGELLLGPARETAARFVIPGLGERTEIIRARYGPQAGVRGAALLAKHELELAREQDALRSYGRHDADLRHQTVGPDAPRRTLT